MSVTIFLALLGGIIVLGFFGSFLFSKTKIPNPVILMLVGIILGPATHFVTSGTFMQIAPYFGTVALILIMFEGGLDLEFEVAISQFNTALFLGLLYFAIVAGSVTVVCLLLLRLELVPALLYGSIMAGTSPAVIFPVLSKLSISKNLKTLLSLETALTEVLTVVSVVLILDVVKEPETATPSAMFSHISISIGISLFFATIAGLLWGRFMGVFSRESLAYMLTLGFVLLLYSLSELAGGDAAITILFFGLILGNGKWIASKSIQVLHQWVKTNLDASHFELDEVVKKINAEVSFLIRTFFFVFMGLLFDFSMFSPVVILVSISILLIQIFGRLGSIRTILPFSPSLQGNHISASMAMVPRGLACAVMAFVVVKSNMPGTETLVPIAFSTILLSNLSMTGFVFFYESKHAPKTAVSQKKEQKELETKAESVEG
ncbi:sodium/hydrogen exchanger [Chloroherpeton thalassium ATCC 35110]|uniref:Sodium/hydrogen exchanger n=1 Tax=Chloroherpeton thalassium (strain ATCC 35110 / GB-78) TaxID=517418 RepID=B3QYC9_CHLT3|nr:cation:proton antiporter [Chloroherpeton thalassium]ACF15095.1 sodium/hydrogen exchanger [Chloroherpeton thalassium ATCC 35110]